MRLVLRCVRWAGYAAVLAVGVWLAFWHHEDARVAVPVFFTMLFAWVALNFIMSFFERRL